MVTTLNDLTYVQSKLDAGHAILMEEKEIRGASTKKKVWKKFRRVVEERIHCVLTTECAPHGYAVCCDCSQICRLGPRGGTSKLDEHVCRGQALAIKGERNQNKQKITKNLTEHKRKEDISAIIKDSAALMIGHECDLQELTRARVIRAGLSEIPRTIIQFYRDGKSSTDRPRSFYEELSVVLEELYHRFKKAQSEAAYNEQQQKTQQSSLLQSVKKVGKVDLHLGLSYSANGDDKIDITWVPKHIKWTLGFEQVNVIGRNLSELIHPDDYHEIVRRLQEERPETPTDGSLVQAKDFSFPDCRVTDPVRTRNKTTIEYQVVFLTGYIRQCIRMTNHKFHEKPRALPWNINTATNYSWPRIMASFLHITTYFQYMTLHSMDGRIIQADKRITMVAGYECDEVINKSAHDFIQDEVSSLVRLAHEKWITRNGESSVTYPLKGKQEGVILYIKSRGEFVKYRDPSTNQLVDGLILNNSLTHEQEYVEYSNITNYQITTRDNYGMSIASQSEFSSQTANRSYPTNSDTDNLEWCQPLMVSEAEYDEAYASNGNYWPMDSFL